jgi:hypothetical protein
MPRLLSALEQVLDGTDFKLLVSLDSLSQHLRYSLTGQSLTVLLAETRQDLEDLASLGQLIYNTKVLLIIPDGESRNVVLGHALRPRYLSYVDGDFADVAAVLERMVKWAESQEGHGTGPHGYGSGSTG